MALVGILMSTQLANAQQNMLMVGNNGKINAISVSSVDYATFNVNKLLTISNDSIEPYASFITAVCTVALSSESNVKTFSVTPEVGVCYSKDNTVPTIEDDCLSLGSELKSYTFTLESLMSGTTYYFRTYVKLAGGVFYGDVVNAKTNKSKTINGHRFIDLGLPSGLLWAETNIGAKTAAGYGNFYTWGETSTKRTYLNDNYFDYNCKIYNNDKGKKTLEKQHDAACVNWGDSCRMPTRDEFAELHNSANCTWTWTSMTTSDGSSINGYQVTSVKNGNSIFLPASGSPNYRSLIGRGSAGLYWSSTLYPDFNTHAYYFSFSSWRYNLTGTLRYHGHSVRPVAEP